MSERVWDCKIGGDIPMELPDGADFPMREAVGRAFKTLTGVDAEFNFSGWGGALTEIERAVVEDRDPVPDPISSYPEFVKRGNFTENARDAKFLAALGLMGEAAEVAALTEQRLNEHIAAAGLAIRSGTLGDHLKKIMLHGDYLDRDALVKELGDVFWYFQHTCNAFGIGFEEVVEANIAKLCDRYPDRYGPAETWGVDSKPGSGDR